MSTNLEACVSSRTRAVAACPACGTENSAGAKLCNECTSPLTVDSDAMFKLGLLLEKSDPVAARSWYQRAAEAATLMR
jgi:predicted amidophosphoribosyltransferase